MEHWTLELITVAGYAAAVAALAWVGWILEGEQWDGKFAWRLAPCMEGEQN